MTPDRSNDLKESRQTQGQSEAFDVVLVCEHATNFIPAKFNNLGLDHTATQSHAAWDPGAAQIAQHLSLLLDAPLVSGTVSRLIYDCNRPPSAVDAMPVRSEVFEIRGNAGLTDADRDARVAQYYEPFRKKLAQTVAAQNDPIIVTIHSFTPVYNGQKRDVEIGILHDTDTRLADAMLDVARSHTKLNVQRNQPYGPEHGVTHTLTEHAISGGHMNVMVEIANTLIQTETQQHEMAKTFYYWLLDAFHQIDAKGTVQCTA